MIITIYCGKIDIFSAWMQYYLHKKKKKMAMEKKMTRAALHHAHRILRVHLNVWRVGASLSVTVHGVPHYC